MSFLLLLLGLFILIVVYGEIIYRSHHPMVHTVINSLLPLSFSIVTMAVVGCTGEFVYGLFTILICFLWLDTRIRLSKWRHNLLCIQCSESCKRLTDST
jgi:hypothetical protein